MDAHEGIKVLFSTFLQRGDFKPSLLLRALKVISPMSTTMLNFSPPLVFLNMHK